MNRQALKQAVSVLLFLAASAGVLQAADRPNLIFINVDDLGYPHNNHPDPVTK